MSRDYVLDQHLKTGAKIAQYISNTAKNDLLMGRDVSSMEQLGIVITYIKEREAVEKKLI